MFTNILLNGFDVYSVNVDSKGILCCNLQKPKSSSGLSLKLIFPTFYPKLLIWVITLLDERFSLIYLVHGS
jgi:hypothetical protein